MLRFFRKEIPKTPIFLPNGDQIQFEPRDARVGFYQTDNEEHIIVLQKLQKDHRGGVFEVTSPEFEAAKKKLAGSMPSNPGWRQEITGGVAQDTMLKRQGPVEAAAVVAAAVNAPKPPTPAEAVPGEAPPPKPPVKPPNVGRRP